MRVFSLIFVMSLWALPLKAWPPIAGPQEAKLLVEIEELRDSLLSLGIHEPSTNSSKLLLYMIGGYGLGATAANILQLNSGNGEWLLTAFAGLGVGLGAFIAFEELPKILFKRARVFQKIKSLSSRSDRFASTRQQFEKLVLDSAIAFYPVIELERLANSLDRWLYLSMVHKLVFKFASYRAVSVDLKRAFVIFYQSLKSLELQAAKQKDLSAIYRSNFVRMQIIGFLGSLAREEGWEAKKNLALHLGISLEDLTAITEQWNFERARQFEGEIKKQSYIIDFLPEDSKVRAELDLSNDGFYLRLHERHFDRNDRLWFAQFKKAPSKVLGSGFWIRFPHLGQSAWHFYHFDDRIFEKINSTLGYAEVTTNPFDSQSFQTLDWEDSFFDHQVFLENIQKKLSNSQQTTLKSICAKAIRAFF